MEQKPSAGYHKTAAMTQQSKQQQSKQQQEANPVLISEVYQNSVDPVTKDALAIMYVLYFRIT